METINVTAAKTRFAELISRAATGERFIIRRRDRPVAAIISATELDRLEHLSQAAHRLALNLGQDARLLKKIEIGKLHPAMAAFGLWRDEHAFDQLVDRIYANRRTK